MNGCSDFGEPFGLLPDRKIEDIERRLLRLVMDAARRRNEAQAQLTELIATLAALSDLGKSEGAR